MPITPGTHVLAYAAKPADGACYLIKSGLVPVAARGQGQGQWALCHFLNGSQGAATVGEMAPAMSALDGFSDQILSGFLLQGLSLPAHSLPGLSLPGFVFPSGVLPSAAVAYVHYLSFMVCFGALVLERRLIKADPARGEAILMVVTDVVYGIAALSVLVSGILRVLHYGQGSVFYTENPLFWWKVGVYLAVGALSLYPTITYILWAIPLRKGELPQVSEALATRLRWVLNIELAGFATIPLLATLMARGVGLPG